jgi:hypothetical protein
LHHNDLLSLFSVRKSALLKDVQSIALADAQALTRSEESSFKKFAAGGSSPNRLRRDKEGFDMQGMHGVLTFWNR